LTVLAAQLLDFRFQLANSHDGVGMPRLPITSLPPQFQILSSQVGILAAQLFILAAKIGHFPTKRDDFPPQVLD
jgi:hypothetical protein